MALTDDLPIPPELAVDTEPLSDEDLAAYFDADEGADFRALLDLDLEGADALASAAERVACWRVEDDGGAEWALRKLAMANEELRRLAEQAQEWQARIGAWFTQASRKPQRTAAVMEEKLADYGLRLREVGGPATLTLPSGVIKTTEQKPKVEAEDDGAIAEYVANRLEHVPRGLPASEEEAALARRAAWRDAFDAAEVTMGELVKLTPKVYAGPLRKLVKVEERPTGQERLTIDLACGHEVSEVVAAGAEVDGLLGSLTACPACPSDPIEGEAMQTIVAVQKEPLTELLPVGPDGEPVPGASVKPGGIVPKVEAR